MKNFTIMIIGLLIFGSFIFASGLESSGQSCSKSTLTVTSNIFIPTYTEATATSHVSTLTPAATDPINPAMGINKDFLVTLATLDMRLNFDNILVYVNVNKSNVMTFMDSGNIQTNGQTYSSAYYLNNVYFVVVTSLKKSAYGYYSLNIEVEAFNSQVKQWIKGSQYGVPIEFTVLEQQNVNQMITNFGNIQNSVFNR